MIDSPPMKKPALALLLLLSALSSFAADRRASKTSSTDDAQSVEVIPGRNIPKSVTKAVTEPPSEKDETPRIARWMIQPLKRGMFIRLPIMDTDPNRGITFGVMPIWVLQGANDDRIEQIHAPSVTYNKNFKLIPTYRYYYYPQEDAALIVRGSFSKYEREALGQYEDGSLAGTDFDAFIRLQYNVDAGQRFFGFGPDSSKAGEATYKEEYTQYKAGLGHPFVHDSPWRARYSKHYQAGRILDGVLNNFADFSTVYPGQTSRRYQQTNENRFALSYDTRDHAVTTGRGVFVESFAEYAIRGFESQYDYSRYGLDGRWFKPWGDPRDGRVFAIQAKYEQLLGPTPPFWILPHLGGKYSLRAYGDGRYVDRGMATVNVEQRFKIAEKKTAGVTTEFQLAPFVGLGEVFDNPTVAAARYARPVVGTAIRAVAKPQVVGSVDFGVGREGLSVFMDINYSF
jgi:hypothetical protein